MFTYTVPEVFAQLRALPGVLQAWLAVLIFVTLIWPISLIRHRVVRIFWRWQWANIFFGGTLMLVYGLSRIASLSHLLFWTPAVVYLIWTLQRPEPRTVRVWAMVAIGVMSASLILDVRDFRDYLNGATGLIGADHASSD